MNFFQILLFLHIIFGTIALISGFVAAITDKGSKLHKKTGTAFYATMIIAILISIVISFLPGHHSPFLLAIGIFSIYGVISGKRCLKSRKPNHNWAIDYLLAFALIANCLLMIFLPIYISKQLNVVLCVFGIIGLLAGVRDLYAFNNKEQFIRERMLHHISKISGGYIAAITAFLVVNQWLPGYWAWFTPTLIGSLYAIYYSRKEKKKLSNS